MSTSKQLLSIAAMAAFLAACDDTCDKKTVTGGFDNFPSAQSSMDESTVDMSAAAADFQKNVEDKVYFAFDSSELSADARDTLGKQAEWLKKYMDTKVVVEGHCDARGTTEYNLALGERRANQVKEFLVSNGIDGSRTEVVSHGKEHPIDPGMTEEAYAKNRRGVTVIK